MRNQSSILFPVFSKNKTGAILENGGTKYALNAISYSINITFIPLNSISTLSKFLNQDKDMTTAFDTLLIRM